MKTTCTMPSANGVGEVLIEKILDEELADKCGLYAKVTIPAGSVLGYHEHHGNGESYFILSGEAVYDDNGAKRTIKAGEKFTTENVRSIRPANGLHPKYCDEIIGRNAKVDLPFGTPLIFGVVD